MEVVVMFVWLIGQVVSKLMQDAKDSWKENKIKGDFIY
jgi:hypothetical protein